MTAPAASMINPQILAILTHQFATNTPAYNQLQRAIQEKGQAEVITASRSYLDALAGNVWECCAVTFSAAGLESGQIKINKNIDIQISHIQTAPRSGFPTKIVPIFDRTDANVYFLDPLKRRVFHLKITPNSKKEVQLNEQLYPPFQEYRLDRIKKPWNDSIVLVQHGSFNVQPIIQSAPSEFQPKPDVSDVKS
jgi:hypothetical protein